MNDTMKALQPETRGQAFAFGLNPYGLTYHLGLQGAGGPRANPKGTGLEGFIAIATELGASVLEIYDPWLRALSDDELRALRERLASLGLTPIVSSGLMMGPFESALRSARILDAKVIRHGLTTVLCGDRHALGPKWKELVAEVRAALADRGPRAADEGRILAIENHQDFGSDELAEFCETTRGLGVCLDTGNAFPVAEAPLDFVRRVAPHVGRVHLKDYRVQFTDEGYRLVRCAIGDGAVPFVPMLDILAGQGRKLNAVLEPGALEARHVRFLRPEWWNLYQPKSAPALAACLAAARVNRLADDADYRTPWERGEDSTIGDYELAMIRRSASNMRAIGLGVEKRI
jgi:3-oxoisoapionate decarboxylase